MPVQPCMEEFAAQIARHISGDIGHRRARRKLRSNPLRRKGMRRECHIDVCHFLTLMYVPVKAVNAVLPSRTAVFLDRGIDALFHMQHLPVAQHKAHMHGPPLQP